MQLATYRLNKLNIDEKIIVENWVVINQKCPINYQHNRYFVGTFFVYSSKI